MAYFSLSREVPERNFAQLIKSIEKQIKILDKANKTGKIAEVYSDELLEIFKQSKNKVDVLLTCLKSFSVAEKLEKNVKDNLSDATFAEYVTLKGRLLSLMLAVSKIQDKELNYYNSVVNQNNKREIENLISSIKRKMFKEYKQKEEFVNSL